MASRIKFLILIFLACYLSGCYTTPVRHLASDIALLQVGKSSKEDVIVYLGEPDEQVDLGEGTQKWLYREKKTRFFQKTPLVGSKFGSPEVNQVVVTLRNDVVSACDYSYSDEGDRGWAKEFSWQEKKQ